jgi:hypothetical protein
MLVLFYYRELMWSIGNIPDFEQDERGMTWKLFGLERSRERPASQVGGCKPLGQSEYKPFKYICTAPPRLRGLLVLRTRFFQKTVQYCA